MLIAFYDGWSSWRGSLLFAMSFSNFLNEKSCPFNRKKELSILFMPFSKEIGNWSILVLNGWERWTTTEKDKIEIENCKICGVTSSRPIQQYHF